MHQVTDGGAKLLIILVVERGEDDVVCLCDIEVSGEPPDLLRLCQYAVQDGAQDVFDDALTALELQEGRQTHLRGRRARIVIAIGQVVFGDGRANGHHKLDSTTILRGLLAVDLWLDRTPLLGLVVDDDAARFGRIGIIHLLARHGLRVRPRERHIPQERALILVDPHAISQPVFVASEPG